MLWQRIVGLMILAGGAGYALGYVQGLWAHRRDVRKRKLRSVPRAPGAPPRRIPDTVPRLQNERDCPICRSGSKAVHGCIPSRRITTRG